MNFHRHNLSPSLTTRSGFTLIELLVVIVVLAMLMAIAIPTLLNQRQKAWDTSTRSDVAHVHKTMKAGYIDNQAHDIAGFANLALNEPNLNMVSTGFDYPVGSVKVTIPNDQVSVLTSQSKSGRKFCTVSVESGANAGSTAWEESKGARPADCPIIAPTGGAGPVGSLTVTNYPSVVSASYPGTYQSTWSGTGATPGSTMSFTRNSGLGISNETVVSQTVNGAGSWTMTISYTCDAAMNSASITLSDGTKNAYAVMACGSGGMMPPPGGTLPPPGGTTPPPGGSVTVNFASYSLVCTPGPFTPGGTRDCVASVSGTGHTSPLNPVVITDMGAPITPAVTTNIGNPDGTWTLGISYKCAIDSEGEPVVNPMGSSASIPGSMNNLAFSCPVS